MLSQARARQHKMFIADAIRPPTGFYDKRGEELRKQRLVENIFRSVGYSMGYEEIETPILEASTALPRDLFSVWDETSFFKLDVKDYNSRREEVRSTPAVLRPEGTLPVCRSLTEMIVRGEDAVPSKLMYSIPCYRNELIEEVDGIKRREFNQLGVECVGYPTLDSDVEVMEYGYNVLRKLGIPDKDIIFRVSNVAVFKDLCKDSGLSRDEQVRYQEALDKYSKCRALGQEQRLQLPSPDDPALKRRWSGMAKTDVSLEEIQELDSTLWTLGTKLQDRGLPFRIDLSVVRGFNYYTGPVFQIDVRGEDGQPMAEVGGGGRYDQAIGEYLKCFEIARNVPATGFAFGTERLVKASRTRKGRYTLDLVI